MEGRMIGRFAFSMFPLRSRGLQPVEHYEPGALLVWERRESLGKRRRATDTNSVQCGAT